MPFLVSQMVGYCCSEGVSAQFEKGELTYEQVLPHVNKYTTTLHAINSAIVKLSKLTYAGKVYRGVSGMALPPEFWEPNAFGVKGGIDGAFMSTTVNYDVAMAYAASRGKGFVFEIQQGMIDRGADISFLSQYPHEREMCVWPVRRSMCIPASWASVGALIACHEAGRCAPPQLPSLALAHSLFGPLTGIEVKGTRVVGSVLVVEAGLSVNLASLTIDQVLPIPLSVAWCLLASTLFPSSAPLLRWA